MARLEGPAGVEEQGMSARVTQEPGRAPPFLTVIAVRAPRYQQPRPDGTWSGRWERRGPPVR